MWQVFEYPPLAKLSLKHLVFLQQHKSATYTWYAHKAYSPFTTDGPLIERMSLTAPAYMWLTAFINQHAICQRTWHILKIACSEGEAWFP